ncbi:MAG TPA: DMT family transporter [Streptosporangiaceae bacterium]|nr:DMT family transporter [Streptosporangiaceae bacterium]
MRSNRSTSVLRREASPLFLGALGVLCFSVTFPATRAAEASFSPLVVGVGRAVPAAALAAIVLAARRQPLIVPRPALRRMLIVAACVGVGFGLLSAIALRDVSSAHGAVLTGLIPAATAGMAVLRAGERPRLAYWAALALGLCVVVGFAVVQGAGRLRGADVLLLVAIAVAGLGYAEGGALAREYGGWRVICWTVILALPATVPVTVAAAVADPPRHVTAGAVAGLAYVSLVSMCLGFFAWYAAMARGGVARVGRLQLGQPALTLFWSVLLLGERVSLLTGAAAAAVIAATAVGRNARVDPAGSAAQGSEVEAGCPPGSPQLGLPAVPP